MRGDVSTARKLARLVNPWLGSKRGHLSDWTTQQWVRATGRRVDLRQDAWLDGPPAPTTGIGDRFFEELGLRLHLCQWSPLHRPFGRMIDGIFARRLGQLRLPLAPLDTSRGVEQELLSLRSPDGRTATAWLRRRLPEGEVLFAGLYSVGTTRQGGWCVKTVFPLPNGYAAIFLVPSARPDGSFELTSPPG